MELVSWGWGNIKRERLRGLKSAPKPSLKFGWINFVRKQDINQITVLGNTERSTEEEAWE